MSKQRIIRAPFCRLGSKYSIAKQILQLIPPHDIYIEPFMGSGIIFFNKETPKRGSVLNDLDKDLIDAFKNIKKINLNTMDLSYIKYYKSANLVNKFIQSAPDTPINTFVKDLYKYCGTFASAPRSRIYKFLDPYRKIEKLEYYKAKLKQSKLFAQSYETIIKKYDSSDAFIFLDPPYEESKGIYKHYTFDYYELRDILNNIKDKFMLTLNDSANIRQIFKGFNVYTIAVPIDSRQMTRKHGTTRRELIITNYEI